ncbi:helix-turn-helix domain-containing protein [Spirosoma sordidisoli]|uniref:DNA-binding protein n=1 Tax=Spirosoma sordidisoli TaxID=2502893 RepID=A0A4Q2UK32_9BACT|nr:DNA-binding protein [Spirosoma sordidisoli]
MHDILLSPLRVEDLTKIINAAVKLAMQEYQQTNTPSPVSDIIGIRAAAEITRLSRARVYALVAQRKIPHFKRGNRLSFKSSELLAWMQEDRRD